jgi:hypothetical protein
MPDIEPREVRASALLWLAAVAAGLFETGLVVLYGSQGFTGAIIAGVLLRLVVFAVVGVLIAYLRRGRNWARLSLAILLGVFGTLSLIIGPIEWLAAGNSLPTAIEHATLSSWLFAISRIGHVSAVLGAFVLMFRPGANAYFRRSTVDRRPASTPRPPSAVRTGRG